MSNETKTNELPKLEGEVCRGVGYNGPFAVTLRGGVVRKHLWSRLAPEAPPIVVVIREEDEVIAWALSERARAEKAEAIAAAERALRHAEETVIECEEALSERSAPGDHQACEAALLDVQRANDALRALGVEV